MSEFNSIDAIKTMRSDLQKVIDRLDVFINEQSKEFSGYSTETPMVGLNIPHIKADFSEPIVGGHFTTEQIVWPEKKFVDPHPYDESEWRDMSEARGWNACIDEFKRLNQKEGSVN